MAHSKRFVKTVPPPKLVINVLKYGPISASFSFYFRSFLILISISTIQIEKSMDGVLGIRTRRGGMVGIVETTELWRTERCLTINVMIVFRLSIVNKK